MFGIGWTEFILVALVVLVFVGPKHMPGMLRKFGKIVSELKVASRELRSQISTEMGDVGNPANLVRDMRRDIKDGLLSPYNDVIKETNKFGSDIKDDLKLEGDLKPEDDPKVNDDKPDNEEDSA